MQIQQNENIENKTQSCDVDFTSQDTCIQEQPVKRGRGRPRKENKQRGATGNYFEPVEKYLTLYLNCEDEIERNLIFKNHLYSPLYYMIQTILMKYYYNKFQIDETADDIIADAFSFIMLKLGLYNPDLGYKAYSYIQTVIKHYIGSKYHNYDKKLKRYLSMEDAYQDIKDQQIEEESINVSEPDIVSNVVYKDGGFINELFKHTINELKECIDNPEKHNLNEKDCNVGMCLIELLNNWEIIIGDVGSHKFNKNIIFSFISESTFLDIKTIRISLKKYKVIYQNSKTNLLNIY
jgi:hypothetical protein